MVLFDIAASRAIPEYDQVFPYVKKSITAGEISFEKDMSIPVGYMITNATDGCKHRCFSVACG